MDQENRANESSEPKEFQNDQDGSSGQFSEQKEQIAGSSGPDNQAEGSGEGQPYGGLEVAASQEQDQTEGSAPGEAGQQQFQEVGPITQDARNMALLCHILGLVGFIGPLVAWLVLRERHWFIDQEGKESLNFQLSMLIYYIAAWLLIFMFIGFLLLPALAIVNLVFVIIAAVTSSQGTGYRYPIAIRFIK